MDQNSITTMMGVWIGTNGIKLIITLVVGMLYFLLDRFSTPRLTERADQGRFKAGADVKAVNLARILFFILGLLLLTLIWGIDFHSILIFATTTITLLGVALFASWSLLSNVTAYFILLLQPTFARGTFIRIFDVDNYIEGYIADLTIFNTKLITENREVILYPNNLILGRPTMINPRDRLSGVGKLPLLNPESKKIIDV